MANGCDQFPIGSAARAQCEQMAQRMRVAGDVTRFVPPANRRSDLAGAVVRWPARALGAGLRIMSRPVTGTLPADPAAARRAAVANARGLPTIGADPRTGSQRMLERIGRAVIPEPISNIMSTAIDVLGSHPAEFAEAGPGFLAAVRTPNGVFKGRTHAEAIEAAVRAGVPIDLDLGMPNLMPEDRGFVDPAGRYLTRADLRAAMNVTPESGRMMREGLIDPGIEGMTGAQVQDVGDRLTRAGDLGTPGALPLLREAGEELAGEPLDRTAQLMRNRLNQNIPGGTLDPRRGLDVSDTQAWALADSKTVRTFDNAPTESDLRDFMRDHRAIFEDDPNAQIGYWFDDETGKWEINVSRFYENAADVARRGAETGEKAVYHPDWGVRTIEELQDVQRPLDVREIVDQRWNSVRRTPWKMRQVENDLISAFADAAEGGPARDANLAMLGRVLDNPDTRRDVLRAYVRAPTPDVLASAIVAGAPAQKWYERSARSLVAIFGPQDSARFAGLIAATSPQRAVDLNVEDALAAWAEWNRRGRAVDDATLDAVIESVPNALKQSFRNNLKTVLRATDDELLDPSVLGEGGLLSGDKVDAFYAGLIGETQRIVLDAWMGAGMGAFKDRVTQPARALAIQARTLEAIKLIEQQTGVRIDPQEAQAMLWTAYRSMAPPMREVRGGTKRGTVRGAKVEETFMRDVTAIEPDDLLAGISLDPHAVVPQTNMMRRVSETEDIGTVLLTHADMLSQMGLPLPPDFPPSSALDDLSKFPTDLRALRESAQRIDVSAEAALAKRQATVRRTELRAAGRTEAAARINPEREAQRIALFQQLVPIMGAAAAAAAVREWEQRTGGT